MKKILVYPHDILRTPAEPVHRVDQAIQELIDEMLETMYAASGVGLAANQVGELKRLVVMDVTPREQGPSPIVLVNPRITLAEGEDVCEEGCLSVPEYSARVKRAQRVQVCGYDRNEKEVCIEAEGLLARCIQHELDHLEGICFVDRLAPVKKALFRRKWTKLRPKDA
ncbi:peptide deformylase [Dissulfurirhabdus thermomarina]|uniref:Peptide deformylase n=1 Tax=Dissulfurirhabdus thermomarina TaxID=1765737 RepID=A0A6N9TLK4_DISTH|nr:peptide deformylase [Dissulfurirhabdus thermomarina]NDY41999.1 peptide deformylase [Dissulfurirhabdus thermomarina]NMX24016.1 peptide deformylase [Dissulfurirhabdus thermomarina]